MTIIQPIHRQGCGCDAAGLAGNLLSIDDALARIASHVTAVTGTERLPITAALGRTLAEPVVASAPQPRFDNAAMDGYAVSSADLSGDGPWLLKIAGRIPAGCGEGHKVQPGTVARIFTGAPLPVGSDAVVMQEKVQASGNVIIIRDRVPPGLHVRKAGEELQAGAVVLQKGQSLGVREIAAAASSGCAFVLVKRRIRVAILATGNEVRPVGTSLARGEIWDVNTPMLQAALTTPQIEISSVFRAADEPHAIRKAFEELSADNDLVISTGAVSVGEEDHVKSVLRTLGCKPVFSGVAIKPGKPISFGTVNGAHWLGLPGNPVSAFVTWRLFGQAILNCLSGRSANGPDRRLVVAGGAIQHRQGRCELRPARLAGIDPTGREIVLCDTATHSARICTLQKADGLVFLPVDADELPEGALLEFLPLNHDRERTR